MSFRLPSRCLDPARLLSRVRGNRSHSPMFAAGLRNYASAAKPADEPISREQEMETMEVLRVSGRSLPYDPWLVPVETMNLHIPCYKSHKKDATWRDHLNVIIATQFNKLQNITTMYSIARDDAFPGIHVKAKWSPQLFRTQSTADSAWLAPFRKIALDTYKQLNEAVANRDNKTVKRLTSGTELQHYLKLARGQNPAHVYVWKLFGERSPCRVLSIRSMPANMGNDVVGTRLLVQALVKFDTLQSLEVYSKKGTLLQRHAEPKSVVEYLIFERRMWFNAPWVVRDRAYEGLDTHVRVS